MVLDCDTKITFLSNNKDSNTLIMLSMHINLKMEYKALYYINKIVQKQKDNGNLLKNLF